MIQIDNIKVFNIEGAIRGMRNPYDSWRFSDSDGENIGEKDMVLAQKLISAGTDHSKFMRQIFVTMDITSSLYFWKEMSTYKVATVANSTSTMHTLTKKPITKDMFSWDGYGDLELIDPTGSPNVFMDMIISDLEQLRQLYLNTGDKRYWRAMIQLLPESFNQMRTWTANYQTLRNIYFARKQHKLQEWYEFCLKIRELPYAEELICLEKKEWVQ